MRSQLFSDSCSYSLTGVRGNFTSPDYPSTMHTIWTVPGQSLYQQATIFTYTLNILCTPLKTLLERVTMRVKSPCPRTKQNVPNWGCRINYNLFHLTIFRFLFLQPNRPARKFHEPRLPILLPTPS